MVSIYLLWATYCWSCPNSRLYAVFVAKQMYYQIVTVVLVLGFSAQSGNEITNALLIVMESSINEQMM